MRNKLIKILQDMGRVAFTNEEKADFLMQHDVVPVERCEHCKHFDTESFHCDHVLGTKLPIGRKEDDFCSYGERRTTNA